MLITRPLGLAVVRGGAARRKVVVCAGACLALAAGAAGQCSPWTALNVAGPPVRWQTKAAYNPVTARMVVFGGLRDRTTTDPLQDTWEWDGSAWTSMPVDPKKAPSKRYAMGLEFDAGSGRVVMYGGRGSAGTLSDTWTWDGVAWTLAPVHGPARAYYAMAVDPLTRHVMIFGGIDDRGAYLNDSWAWDGVQWSLLATSGPPRRAGAAMCLDEARERVVLFGGFDNRSPPAFLNDTWEWDGALWTQRAPLTSPEARGYHAMTFEGALERVVMFGGQSGTKILRSTWSWDGSDWALQAESGPSARAGPIVAYGGALAGCVLFGGADERGAVPDPDTWLYVDREEPPTAVAGPDQNTRAGGVVHLDGTGSFDDNTPSEQLTFEWYFAEAPPGSAATFADPYAATTSFVADLPGTYLLELWVTDECSQQGMDTLEVSSTNLAPAADAGPDLAVIVGDPVLVDGTASSDPENDPLTYLWILAEQPTGSTAVLLTPLTAICPFVPDVPGSYVLELVVSDPFGPSTPDTVVVTVITGEQFVENTAMEAMEMVAALPPGSVTSPGNQNALGNFLAHVIHAVQRDDLDKARSELEKAIERTDGCALRGQPDSNGPGRDWITDCGAQLELYADLTAALDAITP